MKKLSRIYIDYAASTPADPVVLKVMAPYWSEKFGNPGSLHSFGQEAMGAVDKAREAVAKSIGRPPAGGFREVVFTGSATESNNLALRGTIRQLKIQNSKFKIRLKLIISAIEHESVLDTARDLEKDGVEVVYIPVNRNGIVDVGKIKEALDERTVLVSVMYVNNEIGSVQPIKEISKIINDFRARPAPPLRLSPGRRPSLSLREGAESRSLCPIFHTDAAQAFGYFNCDVDELDVDLMTLSGQKIYGPKGVGALFVRNQKSKIKNQNFGSDSIAPIITGGGQEFGLRSGTENVPGIVGFGKAIELAVKERNKNTKEVRILKDYFWRGLKRIYPGAEVNGMGNKESRTMAPHILNVYFPTEFAGDFLIKLDLAGIAASSGSACSARSFSPSYVLQALGLPQERVRASLRFSFGKNLRTKDLDEALKRMKKIIG